MRLVPTPHHHRSDCGYREQRLLWMTTVGGPDGPRELPPSQESTPRLDSLRTTQDVQRRSGATLENILKFLQEFFRQSANPTVQRISINRALGSGVNVQQVQKKLQAQQQRVQKIGREQGAAGPVQNLQSNTVLPSSQTLSSPPVVPQETAPPPVTVEMPSHTTVTESREVGPTPDEFKIDSRGVIWRRSPTGTTYWPLREHEAATDDERPVADLQTAPSIIPADVELLRNTIRDRNMGGKTFRDTMSREWLCDYAGQLTQLRVNPPMERSLMLGGAEEIQLLPGLPATTSWRGAVILPNGVPLPEVQNEAVTLNGVTYTRTARGVQATAVTMPEPNTPQSIRVLGQEVTLNILAPSATATRIGSGPVEKGGGSIFFSVTPPEAEIVMPLPSGITAVRLPGGRIAIRADNTATSGPQSFSMSYRGVETPPIAFEVAGRSVSLSLTTPVDGLPMYPGETRTVAGSVSPRDAQLTIQPMGPGTAVKISVASGPRTIDGVTYQLSPSPDSSQPNTAWLSVSVAPGAAVGNRQLSMAGVPPVILPIATGTRRVVYGESAPSGPRSPETLAPSRTLPNPGDYESRVPAGTVRILTDGLAYVKNGEGTERGAGHRDWTMVSGSGASEPRNHDYVHDNSLAQIRSEDAARARTPSPNTTVQDTAGRTWIFRREPDGRQRWWLNG